ncbi:MAG: tRNA1(Val) (adenine(37)-N6)-methyltransferase [Hoylesella buccalis]
MSNAWFQFKQFTIRQDRCAMKVGTDGVLLGAWAMGGQRILDVGTGTGLIALMMAQRYAACFVEALEIDRDACRQAKVNVEASPFADRVRVREVALQQFETVKQFDSIVSNPPYFVEGLRSPDAKAFQRLGTVTRFPMKHCANLPIDCLPMRAKMSVVLPVESVEQFSTTAVIAGFYLRKKYLIKTVARKSPKRCLMAWVKRRPEKLDEQTLTLFDDAGEMSEWYAKLMNNFYL